MAWSHAILEDADGTFRVQVTDEDEQDFPVARQLTRGQAEKLIERIARESRDTGQPIKTVIRDPYFMAATVITVKRMSV